MCLQCHGFPKNRKKTNKNLTNLLAVGLFFTQQPCIKHWDEMRTQILYNSNFFIYQMTIVFFVYTEITANKSLCKPF